MMMIVYPVAEFMSDICNGREDINDDRHVG